jgi:hypothetical protein
MGNKSSQPGADIIQYNDSPPPSPANTYVPQIVQAQLGQANDFTISLDLAHSAASDFNIDVVKDAYVVDCNGTKVDLKEVIGGKGSWDTLTLGLSREFVGGYLVLEFYDNRYYGNPKNKIGTTTIPLELTVVRKKQHKATHSVVIDPNFLQINTTSFFYQFQKEMKFEATLSCILESEFAPDPVTDYVVIDEELEVENLQPYTDTHGSYNTAKLQMVNQKKFRQYVVLTIPDLPHIRVIYWLVPGDQNPRCVIVEQIAEKYFTLWHRLNSIDAPKKVWKSLRRLAESQPVEGGLGLSESFWGYKEISAQVTIENIPKDDAHAPDRLMLRTSSGRGGLKSSTDYMDIFYASKTGSMDHLRKYVLVEKINVNKKDEHGNLPVYYAALCGQFIALRFLFENGAELDLSSIDGQRAWLAAHSIKIRDLLRAKSKYSDVGGHQVILQKAFRGTVSEMQGTINSGQVNVNFVGASGLRAIDYACVAENAPVIEFLKKHESFDTLISGFRSMVRSGDHHDVVININGQRIKAHRMLLLSACNFFPQIIGVSNEEFNKPISVGNNNNNTNTSEVRTGPIEVTVTQPIVPLDAHALRAFVHYLYYGAVDWFSNKEVLEQLAGLAKKYEATEDFEILKKYCRAEKITVPKIAMPSHFGKSLLSYVNNAEFHDVVLEIHGKQIYAHKVILAARSQYFDAMFSSDMVEAKQYVLSITDDISVETFLLVLEFIYTDQITDAANLSPTVCLEMILLAHKYMLTALKAFLDDFICSNFDIETDDALDSYTFAAELKVERFQKKCAKFIKSNIHIERLPSYKELSKEAKKKIHEDIVQKGH